MNDDEFVTVERKALLELNESIDLISGTSLDLLRAKNKLQEENEGLRRMLDEIESYSSKHFNRGEMWSAVIMGIIQNCDFRDAKAKDADQAT